MISLFHLFFPSWRFFEGTGSVIGIQFRAALLPDERQNLNQTQWQELFPPHSRSLLKIFWNPRGNEVLTILNHASQLILSLPNLDQEQIENHQDFIVIKNYIESQISTNSNYQFKLTGSPNSPEGQVLHEDLVVSATFKKSEPK